MELTVNDLIKLLQKEVDQGRGNNTIQIWDEDLGMNKQIQSIEPWETLKENSIDINIGC